MSIQVNVTPNDTIIVANDNCQVKNSEYIVNVYVVGVLCLFGLTVNVLTIITLERDRKKFSTTVILQGLAVTDSIFLIYSLLYCTLRTAILYHSITESTLFISKCIFAFALPWGWTAQTASIWIVTMVTIDRYLAVCRPFFAERHCTLGTTRRVLTGICLSSLVFNCPRFVYYYYMAFKTTGDQVSCGIFIGHLDMSHNGLFSFRTIYHIGLTYIFLFIIPFPIIAGLNIKLIKEISVTKKRHLKQGQEPIKDRTIKATVNLVVIVTVFIVCETPDLVASVLKLDHIEEHLNQTAMDNFMMVKELLLVVNSATNFLVYCLFYEKFRKLLKTVCCREGTETVYWSTTMK